MTEQQFVHFSACASPQASRSLSLSCVEQFFRAELRAYLFFAGGFVKPLPLFACMISAYILALILTQPQCHRRQQCQHTILMHSNAFHVQNVTWGYTCISILFCSWQCIKRLNKNSLERTLTRSTIIEYLVMISIL